MSQQINIEFYDCYEFPKNNYKKVENRFVCLNYKTGGGPKVTDTGYVNYGAWYNHCYSTRRDKNCKFDNF